LKRGYASCFNVFQHPRRNQKGREIETSQDLRDRYVAELNELRTRSPPKSFQNVDRVVLSKQRQYLSYPTLKSDYKEQLRYMNRINDLELTIKFLDSKTSSTAVQPYLTTESAVEDRGDVAHVTEHNENVIDTMGEQHDEISAGQPDILRVGKQDFSYFTEILSRPVIIDSGVLTNGSFLATDIPVWDSWSLDPVVRSKLRNFIYFKGNLKVRITVTGMKWNYGRLLASYQPYPARNDNLTYLADCYAADVAARPLMLAYLSQAPGARSINITENKPVEISVPFIANKNYYRLFNNSASIIGDTTSFEDFEEAGSLYLWSINSSEAINATADSARYIVTCWAEDVEFGPVTGTQMTIRTESKVDEREKGPVEKFSSGARQISSALEKVPMISTLATASTYAFSALENVSSLFGWSKPVYIDNPYSVKNVAFQNGAHLVGSETNYRITLDPKQELTVDPRSTGCEEDAMAFSHILERESYLTTFEWIPDDTPFNSILWKSAVSPTLNAVAKIGTVKHIVPTPMSFVATPFSSWHGDIEFRFEVTCSGVHKGKFAVFWEPNVNQRTILSASLSMNKQHMYIIDIEQTDSVTLVVNWATQRNYLKVSPRNVAGSVMYTGTPLTYDPTNSNQINGLLWVTPFTDLVSPDNSNVKVNVYVKAPNLQVNGMKYDAFPSERAAPVAESRVESRIIAESSVENRLDAHAITPREVSKFDINDVHGDSSSINLYHYGERPVSFRSLLKRYVTIVDQGVTTISNYNMSVINLDVPIIHDILLEYNSTTKNIQNEDLLSYLRYAYLGMRGGVRHRIRFFFEGGSIDHAWTKALLAEPSSTNVTISLGVATIDTSTPAPDIYTPLTGGISMDLSSNGGFEVELPFYCRNLYNFSFASDMTGSNPGDDYNSTTRWYRNVSYSTIAEDINTTKVVRAMVDFATGEDFSLMRFQGCPAYTGTTAV
jgi:hypothetical protein